MMLKNPLKLEEQTWTSVDQYLKSSKKILWPVGSTEQHSPYGILGIDFLTSQSICEQASAQTQIMMAPVLPFGMAVHHMGFSGTMTFSPLVYVQAVSELLKSLTKHGFEQIYVVNGHGGNIAPLTTAFCEVKQKNETCDLKLINWWHLPSVTDYEKSVFGSDNGFHATCGEISVTRFTHPQAYEKIKFAKADDTPEKKHWPMSPEEFRHHFPDGRMNSQPILSSPEHGKKILTIAVQSLIEILTK